MATDLFVAACGIPVHEVLEVVPPACRRQTESVPIPGIDGGDAVVEFAPWRPRTPARHLLPAWSALGGPAAAASVRLELSVLADGAWSPWVAGATLGPVDFEPLSEMTQALTADIDEFVARRPAEAARLRLRVRGGAPGAPLSGPWFVSLSAWDGGPISLPALTPPPGGRARIHVPPRTQMTEDPAIRHRICSPASVGMVLEHWGRRVETVALAEEMYHPALDRYGVWPAAIRAAGRHGVAGYLLRFPDWQAAVWCLDRGLPIIASIRYGAGELTGAAIPATTGHLVVLAGYEDNRVLVNDPAAPTPTAVIRSYPLAELARVWLERAGVGYVLFPAPVPASARTGGG